MSIGQFESCERKIPSFGRKRTSPRFRHCATEYVETDKCRINLGRPTDSLPKLGHAEIIRTNLCGIFEMVWGYDACSAGVTRSKEPPDEVHRDFITVGTVEWIRRAFPTFLQKSEQLRAIFWSFRSQPVLAQPSRNAPKRNIRVSPLDVYRLEKVLGRH
ncbi:hypothetical protein GCM10007937_27700 [Mesorhizobium albiziae]|nr:hypothetical protein GCM10007937_27700 [Mesorhizobium albiziae]